ncbi:MAG: AMP-binding protein [Aquisalimonadaceae bacterium]
MATFGELIQRNGVRWPRKDAFVELEHRLTWGAYNARTDALGHALRRLGIGVGDRVAILAYDCIEVAETFGACMKIGAIRVGLNPRLAPREIAALIADCDPRVLFVHRDCLAAMDGVGIPLGEGAQCRVISFGEARSSEYEKIVAAENNAPELVQTPHDVAMIAYTTGSTGLPKGAIYLHEPFLRSILYIALAESISADARWLHAMPAAGIPIMHLMRNIFHAAATVIVGHWDAERALHLLERERTTNTVLVPTMLNSLLASPALGSTDVSSMKLLGYGASTLPAATIRSAMEAFGCPFLQMFGTTEMMGMSMMLLPSDHERGLRDKPEILASAGKALPFVETRLVDDDGNEVPLGETGELCTRSDVCFAGYWNAPEKTVEALRDGWLYTGDMARQDGEGYIYLGDRTRFRIKTGGYNVFPTEVENVLAEHPAVNEVAVVGLPDAQWGDRIHAVVSLKSGAQCEADELREFCRGKIATYKVPKSVAIWEELPKGPTGKLQKRDIIEFYATAGSDEVKK